MTGKNCYPLCGENGIEKIINIGCSIESCKSTLELTKQYPFVYGAMGIHPSDIGDLNEDTFYG